MVDRIELRPAALRQARTLPVGARERVLARINLLAYEPRGPGVRKLQGYESVYRASAGAYRILYEVLDDVLVVVVIRIGHRRDVFR